MKRRPCCPRAPLQLCERGAVHTPIPRSHPSQISPTLLSMRDPGTAWMLPPFPEGASTVISRHHPSQVDDAPRPEAGPIRRVVPLGPSSRIGLMLAAMSFSSMLSIPGPGERFRG